MQPLDDLFTPRQPIKQVAKQHAIAAVLRQIGHQLWNAQLRIDQVDIFDEPSEHAHFCLLIYRLYLDRILLNL